MDNEYIRKYLSGELSLKERYDFEREMEDDLFLQEGIEGLEAWKGNNELLSMDEIKKLLGDKPLVSIDRSIAGELIIPDRFRYVLTACLISVFSIATWHAIVIKKESDEQVIFEKYFKPLTNPDAVIRGENDSVEESQAIQSYEKEDYFAAVKYYEKLTLNDPTNVKFNLMLGVSLLATNQPKKAIPVLNKILTSIDYKNDIQWYLGLAYLKNKDTAGARAAFENLLKEEGYYTGDARDILDMLNGKTGAEK
jgi:predicted Zn-dependent protease